MILDDFADELKACEHVVKVNAMLAADLGSKLGGYDGLDRIGLFGHGVCVFISGENVVEKECANLVTGDGNELVFGVSDHDAHAVSVGVGGKHEITAYLFGKLNAERECFGIFGVGALNGGKVTVDHHLFAYGVEVLESAKTEHFGDKAVAAAVKRCVNHLEVVGNRGDSGLVNQLGSYVLNESVVDDGANDLNLAFCNGSVEIHALYAVKDVGSVDVRGNEVSLFKRQLSAVFPICLIAVVFLGVMGSGYVNAGNGAEVTDGKRKNRGGTQGIKEINLDAVGGKHFCGYAREEVGVVTAVVCDHNAAVSHAFFEDQVGKALCCVSNGVNVHGVHTCDHGAAKAARSESEIRDKAEFNFLVIAVKSEKLLFGCFVNFVRSKPSLIFLFVIHNVTPFQIYNDLNRFSKIKPVGFWLWQALWQAGRGKRCS